VRLTALVVLFLAATGCKHRFPLPYTTDQLIRDSSRWPGEALVHYVGQPNADISVCALAGPNSLKRTDEELVEPFVEALEANTLTPERWQSCATRLVPALAPAEQEFSYGRLARVILSLLTEEQGAARLIAAHEVLATRPRGPSPSLEALLGRLSEWPRERLAPTLPPVFDALVATLELDHGRLGGKALTEAEVVATQDELLLSRMATRLPDAGLRESAQRRLIRLRIERSEFTEVKARAAEVEAAVMAQGRWAQPVSKVKLSRPEPPLSLPFLALVRQNIEEQVATLLVPGETEAQLMPVLDLKASLRFPVGWSKPLALCQPAAAMQVDPCIEAREVEVANPMVQLDAEGMLRLPERLEMAQAFDLARADEGLVLLVRLSGQLVTSLQVPLRFEAPRPIHFVGREAEQGPSVNVVVIPATSVLLFSTVSESGERKLAVLPRGVSSSFEVASIGGDGVTGRSGRTGHEGSTGYSGASATCPSMPGQAGGRGGDGGQGGDGGDGGPGGDGGLVSVTLQCGGPCQADEQFVRTLIKSRGGDGGSGGSGGSGGRGGSGGSGGSGTSCTTDGRSQFLSSGSSGSSGNDGPRGRDGYRGSDGRAGPVQFRVQ
jgi:hypothetical protein